MAPKAKKKTEEPVTHTDLFKVSGKDLRLAQEAHAKMTVYAEQTEHKLAEAIKERDAYKKAKEENDERFMRERDDARAKAEEFRIEMDKQAALKKEEWQAKLDAKRDLAEYKTWAESELSNASAQARAAVNDLEKRFIQMKADYEGACKTIAEMHAAAVGEVRGPSLGPVEDVAALHLAAKNMAEELKALRNQNTVMSIHAGVLDEIHKERVRQDAKWGEQNHPDGTCAEGPEKAKAHADAARSICNHFAKIGKLTWAHILTEELMEAYAETDPEKLITELIQVSAVAASWVECIRRRLNGRETGK